MASKKNPYPLGEIFGGLAILALLALGFAVIVGLCVKVILSIVGAV